MARENFGARKAAIELKQKHYFTGLPCSNGHVSNRQTTNGRCIQCINEWTEKNKKSVLEASAKFAKKSREKIRTRVQEWTKNNQHKKNNNEARRRASTVKRTPQWLSSDDQWMIEQAYDLAALRTKMLGFPWHVDHILPLQGRFVSGLHVPTNLQVIPAQINLQKSNRYEVL